MNTIDSDLVQPLPCVNFRTCQGHAVQGRIKCEYCQMADEEADAERDKRLLKQLERKPRNHEDVWK
jgi:hypothetical protein